MMANIVLTTNLLYNICEVYLDDILIHGNSEDAFVNNVRRVFERFRSKRITLNPKKVRLGMEEVEFVDHTLTSEGMSFSKAKRDKVLNFPKPTQMKHMKAFLGLANYFRSHIRDFAVKVRPLHQMVTQYERRKKLKWTAELEECFNSVQREIASCPMLYFPVEGVQLQVNTDASDYGVGAYIYQIIDGEERPIAFESKSLSKVQCRWSTVEKEAFAIYYTLMQHKHLLRDTKFTLHTDHLNLTYLNLESSAKVKRWKLAIQEYDFDVKHVAGVRNVVADAFSRLCEAPSPEKKEVEMEYVHTLMSIVVPDEETLSDEHYRLIESCHNRVAGHHGVAKTVAKLQKAGHKWKHMRRHVKGL